MEELMKLQKRKIMITPNKSVQIQEQTLFKANGDEGLHLWEASIVLARYFQKYPELLNNKTTIELGSGCGLLGISCLIHTNLVSIALSDYQDSVLNNLINNIQENKINHTHNLNNFQDFMANSNSSNENIYNCVGCFPGRFSFMKLDWNDYDKHQNESFDVILGAELIWQGGSIEALAKIIKNLLKSDGKAYISMPKKRSMTQKFIEYVEANEMKIEGKIVEDDDLLFPPMETEKESKKYFESLKNYEIMIYEITKNSNKNVIEN